MNKDDLSSTVNRGYDNSYRRAQAERTRERILEAAIEAIADPEAGSAQEVTLSEVAQRAGVSEPTLYRHFGSRERLFDEIEAMAQERLGLPPIPERAEDFPDHVRRLFERFTEASELVRAITRTGLGRQLREHGKAQRTEHLRRILAGHVPHLGETELDLVTAAIRVLVSYESFEKFTGELGLSPTAAAEAAAWSVERLLAGLGSETAPGPRTSSTPTRREG